MQFISHGDFMFPFTAPYYLYKQLYIWSFRTGTPNPDGVIKMPGRLPELAMFALTNDNLAVSYFFLASSMAIVFAAFYFFAAKFLRVKSRSLKTFGALFYTINPVTLGNLAKTGLVLAAAMLPISLVAVKYVFARKQLRYLLLWIVCLNISLIHPFTFIINGVVSGLYFLYLAWDNKQFIRERWRTLVLFGGIGLLLSAYFLLPMAGMRTISKDIIDDSATSSPTDYTAMVEILSTRDILTGFSLSKDVVIDFAYYGGGYMVLYFTGILLFYMLLFGIYVLVEKQLSDLDRRRIILLLGAFLLLVLLAAVTVWNIDVLIKFIIQLPGGWAFRSPLKWQLYIPLTLTTMLVILLTYMRVTRWRRCVYGGLTVAFLLMNTYLLTEVYLKLLEPRPVEHFASLQNRDFQHENMLLVSSDDCATTDIANRRVRTELKQVLVSKDIQTKQIKPDHISTVNLAAYNYVLDCQNLLRDFFKQHYDFRLEDTYADNAFQLYANQKPRPYMYASDGVFLTQPEKIEYKQAFADQALGRDFDFADARTEPPTPIMGMTDPYLELSFNQITGQTINATAATKGQGKSALYVRGQKKPLYYKYDDHAHQLKLSTTKQPDYEKLETEDGFQELPIDLPPDTEVGLSYHDPDYDYENLLPNASLEQGNWQEKAGDCYATDGLAELGMDLDQSVKTEGNQSLKLWAKNHIACTGPEAVPVTAGDYLLGFDYQSDAGKHAGYAIMLNKPDRTILSRQLRSEPRQWTPLSRTIQVPKETSALRLLVRAHPDTPGILEGTAHYDNFRLTAIPDIQNRFYLVQQPETQLVKPAETTHRVINPTKTTVRVSGASEPFYLMTKESYSPQWRLALDNGANSWLPFARADSLTKEAHIETNGSMNAWYVDPAKLCQDGRAGCTRQADGSYQLDLVAEFMPQRWLYLGIAISSLTFLGCLLYVAGLGIQGWRQRGYVQDL